MDWLNFQELVREWRDQRGTTSSTTAAVLCPAYQRIIGMGKVAVPFIVRQLRAEGDDPDQWFWALEAITRAQPVVESDRGDRVKMARAWIQWLERAGYARQAVYWNPDRYHCQVCGSR